MTSRASLEASVSMTVTSSSAASVTLPVMLSGNSLFHLSARYTVIKGEGKGSGFI